MEKPVSIFICTILLIPMIIATPSKETQEFVLNKLRIMAERARDADFDELVSKS